MRHSTRMRTLAAALLCLAALTAPALADSYTNARFGYTLTYPGGLFAPQSASVVHVGMTQL